MKEAPARRCGTMSVRAVVVALVMTAPLWGACGSSEPEDDAGAPDTPLSGTGGDGGAMGMGGVAGTGLHQAAA